MHILILEDEIPARKKLVTYLTEFFGASLILDHVRTVKEGIHMLDGNPTYDLILSDIKLLDGLSFEVFEKVEIRAPIIFCTAYNEHLLQAFQTNGIAYILKPYSLSDLHDALKKYKILFQSTSYEKDVFRQLKHVLDKKEKSYKKRFAIKKQNGIKLLNTMDISLIQANGDFCKINDINGKLHSVSRNISALTTELNPNYFFRINRSQIIHIKHIREIMPYSKNRLLLKVHGTKDHLITSSSVTKEFRKWLEQ